MFPLLLVRMWLLLEGLVVGLIYRVKGFWFAFILLLFCLVIGEIEA